MWFELVVIFIVHWLADFVFQSREIAKNKSDSWIDLTYHVTFYTVILAAFINPALLGIPLGYAIINGALHFVTDAATSRMTKHFYENDNMDMFFNTIGFDQLIHYVTLFLTYVWLV